jgi:hypothetical protein
MALPVVKGVQQAGSSTATTCINCFFLHQVFCLVHQLFFLQQASASTVFFVASSVLPCASTVFFAAYGVPKKCINCFFCSKQVHQLFFLQQSSASTVFFLQQASASTVFFAASKCINFFFCSKQVHQLFFFAASKCINCFLLHQGVVAPSLSWGVCGQPQMKSYIVGAAEALTTYFSDLASKQGRPDRPQDPCQGPPTPPLPSPGARPSPLGPTPGLPWVLLGSL